MKKTLLTLLATAAMSASALAADIKPAIIYDLGGKFDKSFNEAAYNGAEKFKTETGIEYREFEIANDAQREQAGFEHGGGPDGDAGTGFDRVQEQMGEQGHGSVRSVGSGRQADSMHHSAPRGSCLPSA